MSSLIKKHSKKSKKQIAYEAIKQEILSNKLKPGALLVERHLCEALNTSRTPVREALQKLANEGLVDFIPQKGAFVSRITHTDLIEIYHLREVLEGFAAALCAQNIKTDGIEILEKNINAQKTAINDKEHELFIKTDIEFHGIIVDIAANKRLKQFISIMMDQIKRITHMIKDDRKRIKSSLEQHESIFNAIIQKDVKQAERSMKFHIKSSLDYHINQFKSYKDFL